VFELTQKGKNNPKSAKDAGAIWVYLDFLQTGIKASEIIFGNEGPIIE
jgi:hypothetical protein